MPPRAAAVRNGMGMTRTSSRHIVAEEAARTRQRGGSSAARVAAKTWRSISPSQTMSGFRSTVSPTGSKSADGAVEVEGE
eukprot:6179407-Pleurochrysis_carterae.AAC.1